MKNTWSVVDKGNIALQLSDLELTAQFQTERARIETYRHPSLGRVLVIDGEIQHVQAWAHLYHEPLVHLPIAFLPTVRSALVFGGGSFYAASELLKYRDLERVVMIDHDPELIDYMSDLYAHAAAARSDRRLVILNGDVWAVADGLSERFDVVINDAVDLLKGPGGQSFAAMTGLLNDGGVCSDVVYRHVFEKRSAQRTLQLLGERSRATYSLVAVPEYPGVLHLLTIWGTSPFLDQGQSSTRNREQQLWSAPEANPCEYFDPRFMAYYLYLPRYVRQAIGGALTRKRAGS